MADHVIAATSAASSPTPPDATRPGPTLHRSQRRSATTRPAPPRKPRSVPSGIFTTARQPATSACEQTCPGSARPRQPSGQVAASSASSWNSPGASPAEFATAARIPAASSCEAPPEVAASGGVAASVSDSGATGSPVVLLAWLMPLHATEAGRIAAHTHTAHPPRRQETISVSTLQDVVTATLVPSRSSPGKAPPRFGAGYTSPPGSRPPATTHGVRPWTTSFARSPPPRRRHSFSARLPPSATTSSPISSRIASLTLNSIALAPSGMAGRSWAPLVCGRSK